ncbi:tRNA (guanine-N(7)-)-methyltransferase [Gammaproteobacteria bacterium]
MITTRQVHLNSNFKTHMNKIKPIRSFVKRQRRLLPNKQKTFDEGWALYGLDMASGEISAKKIFDRNAPLILEIGFGMGITLLNSAKKYPEQDFIGIEVHQPGIVTLLAQLKAQPLSNVRIYNEDAVIVLEQCIPDDSLEKILIFFPDPWQKNRHHKRRLIQPKFVALIQKKLKSKGVLHIATDWEDYANHITAILKTNLAFTILEPPKSLPFLADRISTKFEQRGKKQGHKIFDLLFIAN